MNVRNLYLWGILFISICSLQSCQTEEMLVKEKGLGRKSGITTEYLKGAEAKQIANTLKTKFTNLGENGQQQSLFRTDYETIDYNNILLVVDSLGVRNYIFRITNHPEDNYKTFHNLVMTDKNGELELTLMKYAMTDVFAQEYHEQLKKIQEFKGTVTAKGLLSTNPCEDIETDLSDNEDNPEVGGGGGSYDGGIEGPSGSQGGGGTDETVCLDVSLSVVCECQRSYPDWESYLASICGNGSNPGYDVTLVVTYTNICPMGLNRCAPGGVIGVLEEKKDCDTSKEDLMNTFPDLTPENAEILANTINTYGRDFGINDNHKLRHFLSQIAHETGGLPNLNRTENLNYTSSSRLLSIFPKYFSYTDPNKENPDNYINNPSMLGNLVYCCGRMGNGDIESGDGYRYRGRGLIQLTGKSNYQNFQNFYNEKYGQNIDFINDPDIITNNSEIAIISAMWYFQNKVINKTRLSSGFNEPVREITKKVNGGLNGLSDRITFYNTCDIKINCLTN